MNSRIPIREPEHIREDVARKLRTTRLSGELRAMLGCLLGEIWTTPRLAEMLLSPQGEILVRLEAEEYFAPFRGKTVGDLLAGVRRVAPGASLDGDEMGYLLARIAQLERLK